VHCEGGGFPSAAVLQVIRADCLVGEGGEVCVIQNTYGKGGGSSADWVHAHVVYVFGVWVGGGVRVFGVLEGGEGGG
jgi:hypothetical protein